VQLVPAVTKDIFVWIVGPRRSANYFNCASTVFGLGLEDYGLGLAAQGGLELET